MTNLRRGMSLAVILMLAPRLNATPAAVANAGLGAHVTVVVKQAPMATFLDTLSAQAKINFILTEGMEEKKVTAFLHDVTVKEALDVVKETDGIDYRQLAQSNTYIIGLKDSPQMREPVVIEGGSTLDQRVTVAIKGASLSQFLDSLSAQSKINFSLEEGLGGIRVTAFLKDVTVREALEIVLTLKGLSCRKLQVKDTYVIGKKK